MFTVVIRIIVIYLQGISYQHSFIYFLSSYFVSFSAVIDDYNSKFINGFMTTNHCKNKQKESKRQNSTYIHFFKFSNCRLFFS